MEPKSVFTIDYIPSSSSMDFTKHLKLSTVFDFFQDIAGLHSDNLGAGIDTLRGTYNITWILMRMRVEINRMSELEEPVTVKSWHQDPKVTYDRDYQVVTRDGEVLVNAVATWIVMDLTSHEIRKGKVFEYGNQDYCTERALDHKLKQLRAPGELEMVAGHMCRFSDIDYNRHVNNARYVDFIMNSYPMSFHEKYVVTAIEINYISEAEPEELLATSKAQYPDTGEAVHDYIELTSHMDGRVIVKAKLEFAARGEGNECERSQRQI